MMHVIVATGLAVVLSFTPYANQETRPDFSGTWTADTAKSDFGQMPAPQSIVAVIEHKDPTVKSTVTQKTAEGDITSSRTLTTDGQENQNTLKTMNGDQPITSRSKWDGKTLVTSTSMTVGGMGIGVVETWELGPDGKTMTVSRQITTDQGSMAQKVVYTKQ